MLKEPSIAKAQTKLKRIPTLITESKQHSNNPHIQKNANQTKNITATKEDSEGKQQHTPNQNKRNKQQKVENNLFCKKIYVQFHLCIKFSWVNNTYVSQAKLIFVT